MAALKKTSLVDQIYAELRNKIIDLTYPLGSKLNVNELQNVFEVSTTPIREAMNRLQAEGLVTYESNIGIHVVNFTPQDIYEIQDLAPVLHATAVRFAMERGDRPKMAEEIAKYVKGYETAKTVEARVKNIFYIINTFYRHCGNRRLNANMGFIQGQQLMLRHLFFRYYGIHGVDGSATQCPFRNFPEDILAGNTDRIIEVLSGNYSHATPLLLEALSGIAARPNGH